MSMPADIPDYLMLCGRPHNMRYVGMSVMLSWSTKQPHLKRVVFQVCHIKIGGGGAPLGSMSDARKVQSLRKNSIRCGSSRHFFFRRFPPPGSQAARAFAFVARSVSA